MLKKSLLNSPHEILLPRLSFHSLGQLLQLLMRVYGSKTQLTLKLTLIDFQGSLGVVFTAHLGCLLGFLGLFTFLPNIGFNKKKVIFFQAKV